MENSENSITLSFELHRELRQQISRLFSQFDSYMRENNHRPKNYPSFNTAARLLLKELERSDTIPLFLLTRLEDKAKNLLRSDSINGNERLVGEIQRLIELIKNLTDLLNVDMLSEGVYVDSSLLKKIIQNELSRSESTRKQTISDIEKLRESTINRLSQLNRDFMSELTSELNNLEQESIRKMLDQSTKRLDELKKVQDGALRHFKSSVQDSIDSITSQIETEIGKFESKRAAMDALLEKVGLAKDADVTISQADKELQAANMFRWLGLGFMCGSIALLVYFFRYYIGFTEVPKGVVLPELKDLGIEFFALRFMTVILVSSPAMYLLKESAAHRSKENLYRQRGTQLLTIRGYLADLKDEQRSEVKHKLAENFFSFHNGKADTSNVPDFIKNMNEAIKLAHAIKTPSTSATDKKEQAT